VARTLEILAAAVVVQLVFVGLVEPLCNLAVAVVATA
jgi:hypothetical protein